MKKYFYLLLIGIFTSMIFMGCSQKQGKVEEKSSVKKEITISAAASLQEPIKEIAKKFEDKKNVKINFNFGASGALQKQIEQGASVDIFISAGKSQMDALEGNNLIDKASRKDIVKNSLVLIVSNSFDKNISSTEQLKDKNIKLVLGEIKTVPAGQYAEQYLKVVKLLDEFNSKITYAKDVKSVLTYVENGEAQAGFVYYSDAVNLKSSYVAYKVPEDTHSPIDYPGAIISNSKENALSKEFMEFMGNSDSKEIFAKYNFQVK